MRGAESCGSPRSEPVRERHAGRNRQHDRRASPRTALELAQQPAMKAMLERTPLARMGTAEDIAAAVDFLCSPAASFITGCDLIVDGGVCAALGVLPG